MKSLIILLFYIYCSFIGYSQHIQLFDTIYSKPLDLPQHKFFAMDPVQHDSNFEYFSEEIFAEGKYYFATLDTAQAIVHARLLPLKHNTSSFVKVKSHYYRYYFNPNDELKEIVSYRRIGHRLCCRKRKSGFKYYFPEKGYVDSVSYDRLYYLNDDTLLLWSLQDYSEQGKQDFKLALFDLKKRKIVKTIRLHIGNAIMLTSHFSDVKKILATKHNLIVLSHPLKPEFYIYDNHLNVLDTVRFPVHPKINSNAFFDSIITANISHIQYAKQKIDFISNQKLLNLPRPMAFAFMDDDLLLCAYSYYDTKKDSAENKQQRLFVYSLSLHRFIDSSKYEQQVPMGGLVDNRDLLFYHRCHYEYDAEMDTIDGSLQYSYKGYKYIGMTSADMQYPLIHLKLDDAYYDVHHNKQSFSSQKMKYVLAPNIYICKTCFTDFADEKQLLVLLPLHKIRENIVQEKHYRSVFHKAQISFVDEKKLKSLSPNKIYRLR